MSTAKMFERLFLLTVPSLVGSSPFALALWWLGVSRQLLMKETKWRGDRNLVTLLSVGPTLIFCQYFWSDGKQVDQPLYYYLKGTRWYGTKTFSSMAGHHLKPWSELEWELDIVGLYKPPAVLFTSHQRKLNLLLLSRNISKDIQTNLEVTMVHSQICPCCFQVTFPAFPH